MSEKLRVPEYRAEHLLPTAEQAEKLRPGEADPLQNIAEADTSHLLAEARGNVESLTQQEQEPNPLQKLEAEEAAHNESNQAVSVTSELKALTLKRELTHIRRQLPAAQRALSKTVHQPVVRLVSEASGKTLARPSGLFGAGLLAFVGSATYLLLTKFVGLAYNFSVFLILFAAGFVLGLLIELGLHAVQRNKLI